MTKASGSIGSRGHNERWLRRLAALLVIATVLPGNFGCTPDAQPFPPTLPEKDLPRWMRQLHDPDPQKRSEAIRMLALGYGPRHTEVVAEAVALLADPDARVRCEAAGVFGYFAEIGGATQRVAQEARSALVGALHDPDAQVRQAALGSLGLLGALTKSDVLAMAACLTDPDKGVQRAAGASLCYLGATGADAMAAIPALEAALGDPDPDMRSGAASALGYIGSKRASTIAGLTRILSDGRNQDAGHAFTPALSLGRIGPAAQSAAPALRAVLSNTDAQTRATAAWALWRVSADIEAAMPVLVEGLTSRCNVDVPGGRTEPDDDARRVAAAALLEMACSGPSAKKIVDDALEKAPVEALAEFTKADRTLIEKLEDPRGQPKSEK